VLELRDKYQGSHCPNCCYTHDNYDELEADMRIIPDDDIMPLQSFNGETDVRDVNCDDQYSTRCFSFSKDGMLEQCEHFCKLPTGVKICRK